MAFSKAANGIPFATACLILAFAVPGSVDATLQQASPVEAAGASLSSDSKWNVGRPDMVPTVDAIEQFRQRIKKNPGDHLSMTVLGQLFYRDGKERDDHQSFVRAENAFREALSIQPTNKSAHIYLVSALQAQHKFQEALMQSGEALRLAPDNLVAISSMGDALLELGDIQGAEEAFNRVAEKIKTPGVLARLSRVAELKGNTEDAIRLIILARDSSIEYQEKAETIAWYDFRLGMLYFGEGGFEKAASSYQSGLQRKPDDTRCIDGLAQVRVAQESYDVAKNLYSQSLALKSNPRTMSALGDLFELTDEPQLASQWLDRAELAMTAGAKFTGSAHLRERARFLLSHNRNLPLALELAEQDLNNRQDIYAYDTLAWALYKNDKFQEAQVAIRQATVHGTRDAEIWYHAGMISASNGDNDLARTCLEKCLEINPGFSVAEAKRARLTLKSMVSVTKSRS